MLPSNRIAMHPGKILLQEFLEPLGLTQVELARALTIPLNRVNELVRGKRGITPQTALLLAGYFKNSPEFWMNLQTAHDLTRAMHDFRKSNSRRRPAAAAVRRPRRSMGAD
jgi:addiction module HigA family antidote